MSLHDPRVAQRYPSLSYDQMMAEMWVITPSGDQYGGADAFRYLSRKLPALWLVMPCMHLPLCMPLWRSVYRWIARRRYQFSGQDCKNGSCHLHSK
jgi:predicted DCC family thiol-disulfide oxidoreductase YuxK